MPDDKTWQPLELIKVTTGYLSGKSVHSPRLDAELLLCHTLGLKRRVDLYAGFEREISGTELAAYRELVKRRAAREPVSRILGHREFMGVDFSVTPDVLSPRPETELLVEAALETLRPRAMPAPEAEPPALLGESRDGETPDEAAEEELSRLLDSYARDVDSADDIEKDECIGIDRRPPARTEAARSAKRRAAAGAGREELRARVLDLGTGSGCIAVSLAAHLPAARVVAVDASPGALAVAGKNAQAAGVAERVDFRLGDWFAGCRAGERFDAVLSNPPYLIAGDGDIWPEVSRYDPPAALYGGQDGLDCYRRIIPDAPEWLAPGGWVFLEVGSGQAGRIGDMLRRRGFGRVEAVKDYGGVERVVKARAPE